MSIRIRNWSKHQHFKDRTPPWIKLYRDLLDDPDWHDLDAKAAKVLVGLWLVASEDETRTGTLPPVRKLAFRLRVDEDFLNQMLNKLADWLESDDDDLISRRYQVDAPETETETETETEISPSRTKDADCTLFAEFWTAYPRKEAKPPAERSFRRLKPDDKRAAIAGIRRWQASGRWHDRQFIPQPSTYLNQRRWEDEIAPATSSVVDLYGRGTG